MIVRCKRCKKIRFKRMTWEMKNGGQMCYMCRIEIDAHALETQAELMAKLSKAHEETLARLIDAHLMLLEKFVSPIKDKDSETYDASDN